MTDIWDNPNTRYVNFTHGDTPLTATVTTSRAEPENNIPKELTIHAISVDGITPEPDIKGLIPPNELDIMEEEIWDAMSQEYEGMEE